MHLSTSDAFEIFTNEYRNQTGDNMKKFELFMEVKIRVEDQKDDVFQKYYPTKSTKETI